MGIHPLWPAEYDIHAASHLWGCLLYQLSDPIIQSDRVVLCICIPRPWHFQITLFLKQYGAANMKQSGGVEVICMCLIVRL